MGTFLLWFQGDTFNVVQQRKLTSVLKMGKKKRPLIGGLGGGGSSRLIEGGRPTPVIRAIADRSCK